MTNMNDLCDFHGGYCDPIGCDTARTQASDGTYWCGQCEAGLIYKYRLLSTKELRTAAITFQGYLDTSGLSWDNRGTDQLAWLGYLDRSDALSHVNREIKRREDLLLKYEGFFVDGYTFWDKPEEKTNV